MAPSTPGRTTTNAAKAAATSSTVNSSKAPSLAKKLPATLRETTPAEAGLPNDKIVSMQEPFPDEAAARVQASYTGRFEKHAPSPLKMTNVDGNRAISVSAREHPALPENSNFGSRPVSQVQHLLANALVHHVMTWYSNLGGIDRIVHQFGAPELSVLCYGEGTFNDWINERLKDETIYSKTPLSMLHGKVDQTQAACAAVYTVRCKIPAAGCALADAVNALACCGRSKEHLRLS